MDLQIGIMCLVIASISSLVIYIILSISSIKEDSFEEAKANRRKIIKQYQDQTKTGLDKAKDKKLKKITKKSKKSEAEDESTALKENDTADSADDPEPKKATLKTMEEVKTPPKEPETKKTNKADKSKKAATPEGVNGAVAASASIGGAALNKTAANKPNADKQPAPPKPAKKKSDEAIGGKQLEGESSVAEVIAQTVNEAPIVVTGAALATQQPEIIVKQAAKVSKKKRAEMTTLHQLSNDREAVNINLLVSLVQKAELSRSEIQLLIDALLNKQQDEISEWLKGRQDPEVKLQKQLSEIEHALKDEKQISAGFQAKLKELRSELNADKANSRHTEEHLVTAQNDCKALTAKLQKSVEENQALAAKIQQCQKQLAEEQATVRQLKDEQAIQQQLTEKQCHEAVVSLQAQANQYAAQSQDLQAANNSLRAEIAMLQENDARIQEEYREVNANLERALSTATFDANALRTELANAERSSTEFRDELDRLNRIISSLKLENKHHVEQNKQYIDQCSAVTQENESLKNKISEHLENGFSNKKKQDIADYEARIEETNKSLKSLKNEIEAKNIQIDEYKLSLSSMEELKSSVHSIENEYQKTKVSLDKATKELATIKHNSPTESSRKEWEDVTTQLKNTLKDNNRELTILRSELETCKQRNNELRNKNWKVVEALTKTEQTLQTRIVSEQKNNEAREDCSDAKLKTSVQRILKSLHPEITIHESKGASIDEWLLNVEEAVKSSTSNSSSANPDLEAQNSQLQSLVQHYKIIITETEGMLNQLQSHVEVEESRWKDKLQALEEELDQLKQLSKC